MIDFGKTAPGRVIPACRPAESSNDTESPWKNLSLAEVPALSQLDAVKSQAVLVVEFHFKSEALPLTVALIWPAVESSKVTE